jgi:hypothetical protein
MLVEIGSQDWRDRKLREWLLLLLRFAITRETTDQSAALTQADELDSLGLRWRPAAPRFFLRTTREVCQAIVEGWQDSAVLRKHLARIDDPRLKRAFHAALGVSRTSESQRQEARKNTRNGNLRDLWRGLPER